MLRIVGVPSSHPIMRKVVHIRLPFQHRFMQKVYIPGLLAGVLTIQSFIRSLIPGMDFRAER